MSILNFENDYILENEVVKLRPLIKNDLDYLAQYSLNEPDLWDYSLTSGAGIDNLKKYFDHALKDKKANKSYPFIVFDKRNNKYAGRTRFYDYQPLHKTVQLGYTWYGKEFHGTGLNKNCKFLLLQFAFEQLQLKRVEFRADKNNTISIAAMKSIGCTFEGVLRSNCASPKGRRDSIILSILLEEWLNTVKNRLISRL